MKTHFQILFPFSTTRCAFLAALVLFLTLNGRAQNLPPPGTLDTNFWPLVQMGAVRVARVQTDGKILIGGLFDLVNGAKCGGIARLNWDGNVDTSFKTDPGANNLVESMELLPGGRIALWGAFTQVDGAARRHFAVLNSDGTVDAGFLPPADLPSSYFPLSIAVQSDGVVIKANYRLLRYNLSGVLSSSFAVAINGSVHAVVTLPGDRLLVGGSFTTVNGIRIPGRYICQLDKDGALDPTFAPSLSSTFDAMVVQADGKIVLGGGFDTVNGVAQPGIARLNPDGSLDTAFAPTLAGGSQSVNTLLLEPAGSLIMGGSFRSVNGDGRTNIARLTQKGLLDTNFVAKASGTDTASVDTLVRQGDGKILIGGDFSRVNEFEREFFARLYSGGEPVSELAASIWTAVEIGWESNTNAVYQIQWATEANPHVWNYLGNPIPGTGSSITVFDKTRDAANKFYRVVKLP
jgi:uncharacterized delta-60 repeat protein